jgi:hypothetical protein
MDVSARRELEAGLAAGQFEAVHADGGAAAWIVGLPGLPHRPLHVEQDRWAGNGAPQGDPKDLPAPPNFTEGWEIGTPDAVISMPAAYDVAASGTINYQYFTVPTNFTSDKWVQAIEVRPGTRSVVHHVLVFCREQGAAPRPPAFVPANPGSPAPSAQQSQQASFGRGTLIANTAPGINAVSF